MTRSPCSEPFLVMRWACRARGGRAAAPLKPFVQAVVGDLRSAWTLIPHAWSSQSDCRGDGAHVTCLRMGRAAEACDRADPGCLRGRLWSRSSEDGVRDRRQGGRARLGPRFHRRGCRRGRWARARRRAGDREVDALARGVAACARAGISRPRLAAGRGRARPRPRRAWRPLRRCLDEVLPRAVRRRGDTRSRSHYSCEESARESAVDPRALGDRRSRCRCSCSRDDGPLACRDRRCPVARRLVGVRARVRAPSARRRPVVLASSHRRLVEPDASRRRWSTRSARITSGGYAWGR